MFSALLAAAGALAGVAVWNLQPAPKPLPPEPVRSDYVLENFELTSLNDRGQESFSVTAPYLERDPGGRSLTMRKPRFAFPDKQQGRWDGSADTAWVAEKGVEIRLNGEVHFTGPPDGTGDRTRFASKSLRVFPKQDLALSDDSVTVTRADSILQGTGLRADMKTHRISLLSDVKGRYAPRRP